MATFLEISEKEVHDNHLHPKRFFGEKMETIGPADHEIIVLQAIIKKDKYEKRKKLTQAKYTALPASLLSG